MAFHTTLRRRWSLDADERGRILGLAVRLRGARGPALALLAPATVLAPFTYGVAVLPFIAAIVAGFALLGAALRRPRRPELPLVASLVWTQLMLVGIFAVATRYGLDALGLLILPAAAACLLFPPRLASAFLLWTALGMAGAAFAISPSRIADAPPILILPLGVLLCVSLPAVMVRRLEVESRDRAMTDPLTGALNRMALELRLTELAEEGTQLPIRVGVLMADLDHFKAVNDELGHSAGDAVLEETVRRMRSELGPLTPLYRAGGEEFVALVAGADTDQMEQIGERLRSVVRDAPIEGRPITVSIGVACSTLDHLTVKDLLARADAALYDAKRTGRDRVAVALTPEPVETPASATVPAAAGAEATTLTVVAPDPAGQPEPAVHRESLVATAVSFGHDDRNWLVRGDFEREHIRMAARAMAGTHHGALGMIGLALAASIPWLGWHLMLPAILPVVGYHVVERRIRRIRRPELALGAAWFAVQLGIFCGALIVETGEPYMLVLFVPMMISVTAVFPSRGILVASVITLTLIVLGGLLSRPDLLGPQPALLLPPMLVVAGFALMSSVAGRSAIEFKTQAVVDPLTGLLTRAALQSRLDELAKQSSLGAVDVSVIAFDVDAFKAVNDTYGHAAGDAVLQAVGEATRAHLRALEWGFRLGGDEFLIVIPASEAQAMALATTLRAALATIDVAGAGITGSFGVAATLPGSTFDFDDLSRRADAALYEAKRSGRNRVAAAPAHVVSRVDVASSDAA
ncbi:MAG: GGDEF domain-containing protein [Solirubrobacteraceae bacterium]